MKRRTFLRNSMAAMGATMLGVKGAKAKALTGFRLPEESVPHERTFMQWPVNRKVHRDAAYLATLQETLARVANRIAEFEPVVMLMDASHEKDARKKLGQRVEVWDIPTDDLWCRDSGPLFVMNDKRELALAHIAFNGWGNKQIHPNDGRIAGRVAKRLGLPLIEANLAGEAGGVETDGDGTLLAHESCWVNVNRNREDRATIEARLLTALGAEKMIWAPGVRGADITDYHIDALARFVRPGVVIVQLPEKPDKRDPWSVSAFETYGILERARDAKDRPLEVIKLPEPYDIRVTAADFVASYVNYYVCNGAVIAAEFGDRKADAEAKSTLQKLYPGREVVTLNVDAIGETGGGIHCATQQQPKV